MLACFDVAAYILQKQGPMTAMKLQKLVYYCQAWSLVWDEAPLFQEDIEAWANGPIVRDLFYVHKGRYMVSDIPDGDHGKLDTTQEETVQAVLGYYGDKSSQWLSDLTHMEGPWKSTRAGLPEMSRSDRVIPLDVIADYYIGLQEDK
jgi:uncharacterized phage-associated protein